MGFGIWKDTPGQLRWLLLSSFIMSVGFYCVIPSLALYMHHHYGWSMALAGLLLGVRQFSQQGMTLFGGAIGDQIGWKRAIVIGTFFRGAGFIVFPFCQTTAQFFFVTVFASLAGALYDPPLKAFVEQMAPRQIYRETIAFRDVLTNLAFLIAAVLGAVFQSMDLKILFIFSGSLYVLVSLTSFALLPRVTPRARSWTEGIISASTDRGYVAYTFLLIGYFYLYCQLYLLVPRFASGVQLGAYGLSIIYGAITLTVIVSQARITRSLKLFRHRFLLVGLGGFTMGASLLGLNLAQSGAAAIIAAVAFGLGTTLSSPIVFEMVGWFARSRGHLAAYFGLNGTAIGIGGLLSTSVGGLTLDLAGSPGYSLAFPGLVCFWIGAAQLLFQYLLSRRLKPC